MCASLLLVKEKAPAKPTGEVYRRVQNEARALPAPSAAACGEPHPSFASLTDAPSLTGRGDYAPAFTNSRIALVILVWVWPSR